MSKYIYTVPLYSKGPVVIAYRSGWPYKDWIPDDWLSYIVLPVPLWPNEPWRNNESWQKHLHETTVR